MAKTGSTRARKRPAAGGSRKKPATSSRTRATSSASARRSTARKAAPSTKKRGSRSPARSLTATVRAAGRAIGQTAAAIAERLPFGHSGIDAIDLLESDHRRLEELLKAGEETTARGVKRRTQLLKTITTELTIHELIEERELYPALKSHSEAKEIVLEGYQEHHVADIVLKELHRLRVSDERWGAKFKVFKENIEHHIEEEEGEMFKTARSVLSRTQLEQLGARMQAIKAQALSSRSD